MKKKKMKLDELSVNSFTTSKEIKGGNNTVVVPPSVITIVANPLWTAECEWYSGGVSC